MELEGTIIAGSDLEPVEGRVIIDEGGIKEIEEAENESDDIILPAFVNAHTHIGDSVAKEAAVGLSLEEAVAPPDSLKHRRLHDASRDELVEAMRRTMSYMRKTGTAAFLDFREFGYEGAKALREASEETEVEPFIFGSEDPSVLEVADGFGASGANDKDFTERRETVRKEGKPFAIHAGEPDDTDIHPALDLDPDLIVHMVHAKKEHLERVSEKDTPIAVCPRANLVLGVGRPPIRDLLDHTQVALGTDNVMLNAPSMFREMEFTAKSFDVSAREVLHMATKAGAEIAGLNYGVIEEGYEAKILVLDGDSDNLAGCEDVVKGVVRRADVGDVKQVVL